MPHDTNRTLESWMALHADVLIPHVSAHFFLGRTSQGNVCRVAPEVPQNLAEQLKELAHTEPVMASPTALPVHADTYAKLLSKAFLIKRQWRGPAYFFPKIIPAHSHAVVQITAENVALLEANHKAWIPAVGHADPVYVLLKDNQVVAICFSPATSHLAHEAGVDTLASHRGQGYAEFVVASWASAVRDLGLEPLYSTSYDNSASQSVAAKLGLDLIGTDFYLS